VNIRNHKIYHRDKQNLSKRLERKQYEDQEKAMFKGSNIHFELADRVRAICYGGIGAINTGLRTVDRQFGKHKRSTLHG
jgi:hypothetical protein